LGILFIYCNYFKSSSAFNNLNQLYSKYLNQILLREYLWQKNELLLNQLNKINNQDLLYFIKKYFNNNNLKKIIVKGN
jgi:predicted Zn-dependent peptidase